MGIYKCELCNKISIKRVTIVNRINGNKLNICRNCMKEFGFKIKQN